MKARLISLLERFGQTHIMRYWDQLSDLERSALAGQIEGFDFDLIQKLIQTQDCEDQWEQLAARATPPPAITLEDFANPESNREATQLGRNALESGKLGMILVAGGQGSRLGFEHPKGMFPIGPVSNRTLYQFHFDQVRARSRQFGVSIPIYVMTSPPTHEETTQFLTENNFFGMPSEDVKIFCQGVMPAVDPSGKLLLETRGKVFVSPDGHGGTLAALATSGSLNDATRRGVEHLFYAQVDNPLVQICNPSLIGYHLKAGSEMTSQVVRKHDPLQKVGNVVEVDGEVRIIEYCDLPEDCARQTRDDGSLKLWAGSIAVHVFDVDFLKKSATRAETLPFHRAIKKVACLDEQGNSVNPDQPNAVKFERFIFDLLPFAKHAIVCEVDPADGFCAVKNAPPANSETPEHVRTAISNLHERWLTQAGVRVEPGVAVEINPMFAPDPETLANKIKAGTVISEPTYFS